MPVSTAGDHRAHIRLDIVGGQLKTGALEAALQTAFDEGFKLGEKRTREKLNHPALPSKAAATAPKAGISAREQSVLTHLRKLKGIER